MQAGTAVADYRGIALRLASPKDLELFNKLNLANGSVDGKLHVLHITDSLEAAPKQLWGSFNFAPCMSNLHFLKLNLKVSPGAMCFLPS